MNIEKRRQFIINFVFFAIIAGILYFTLSYLVGWLMPFIIGFIIAYLMNPLISWTVRKTGIKRHALAYFYTVSLAVLFGLIVWLLVYLVIRYSTSYFYLLPDFVTNDVLPAFDKVNVWITHFIAGFSPELKFQLSKIQVELYSQLKIFAISISKQGLVVLTDITKTLPFVVMSFVFTVLATVFINIDFPNVKAFLMATLPPKFRVLSRNIKGAFKETVGKYLIAYGKIMSVTFIELCVGLLILRVPNAIFVAFFIALFDIMPVLGTGGIMIPWIAFSFIVNDIHMGVGLLITYGVISLVRQFIEPRIVGKQLGLNPIITLISIYLGFIWFGVTGMLIVPITANIVIRLYREGKLKAFINFEELYFDDEAEKEKDKETDMDDDEFK